MKGHDFQSCRSSVPSDGRTVPPRVFSGSDLQVRQKGIGRTERVVFDGTRIKAADRKRGGLAGLRASGGGYWRQPFSRRSGEFTSPRAGPDGGVKPPMPGLKPGATRLLTRMESQIPDSRFQIGPPEGRCCTNPMAAQTRPVASPSSRLIELWFHNFSVLTLPGK